MMGPIVRRLLRGKREIPASRRSQIRGIVVNAVLANPLDVIGDPGAKERLLAGLDLTFDELGLDSLARLTLALELDVHGLSVSESDVNGARSIDGLVELLVRMS